MEIFNYFLEDEPERVVLLFAMVVVEIFPVST